MSVHLEMQGVHTVESKKKRIKMKVLGNRGTRTPDLLHPKQESYP